MAQRLPPKALACVAAVVLGLSIVLLVRASSTWLALLLIGGVIGVAVVWSDDVMHVLLYAFVLTAPIAITKSIVARGGVYPSSLELWLADLPFVALLAAWIVDGALAQKRVRPLSWWGWLVLPICGWAWISGAIADDRVAGLLGAVNQTKFVLQFVILYSLVTTPRILRHVLVASGAGLVLNLLMAGAQVAAGSPLAVQGAKAAAGAQIFAAIEGMQTFRPSGFLLHPNPFAAYLVMVLPVPIVFVILGRHYLGPRIWWSSLALAGAGTMVLLLTLSRGGWISFVVATVFALAVIVRRHLVPTRRVVALGSVALAVIAAVLVVNPTIVYRVTRGDKRSTETRVVLMEQAAMVIRANPVFGVGLGNYSDVAVRHVPASFASLSPEYRESIRKWIVHNGYLLIWSEQGIVGLLLHIGIILAALNRLRMVRVWWDPVLHGLAIGLGAGLVGQSTFYLFDHFFLDLRPGVLWVLLGLYAAVFKLQEIQSLESVAVAASRTAAPAPRRAQPRALTPVPEP